MRQAGVIAAAGIYALENNVERLLDDHNNARKFAEGISDLDGISVDLDWVQTNIVMIDIDPSRGTGAEWMEALSASGVAILATAPQRLRAVFHLDVSGEDTNRVVESFNSVHSNGSAQTGNN